MRPHLHLLLVVLIAGCGGDSTPDPGPGPNPNPNPNPYPGVTADSGPGYSNPVADGSPLPSPTPPPTADAAAPASNCAAAGPYAGTFNGSVDAVIPLMGPQKMPVTGNATFTLADDSGQMTATGQIQIIDPTTNKPWYLAPNPFQFQGAVSCDSFTAPLNGDLVALGMKIAFVGTVKGTYQGGTFNGTWSGSASQGIKADGTGTWTASKQ